MFPSPSISASQLKSAKPFRAAADIGLDRGRAKPAHRLEQQAVFPPARVAGYALEQLVGRRLDGRCFEVSAPVTLGDDLGNAPD